MPSIISMLVAATISSLVASMESPSGSVRQASSLQARELCGEPFRYSIQATTVTRKDELNIYLTTEAETNENCTQSKLSDPDAPRLPGYQVTTGCGTFRDFDIEFTPDISTGVPRSCFYPDATTENGYASFGSLGLLISYGGSSLRLYDNRVDALAFDYQIANGSVITQDTFAGRVFPTTCVTEDAACPASTRAPLDCASAAYSIKSTTETNKTPLDLLVTLDAESGPSPDCLGNNDGYKISNICGTYNTKEIVDFTADEPADGSIDFNNCFYPDGLPGTSQSVNDQGFVFGTADNYYNIYADTSDGYIIDQYVRSDGTLQTDARDTVAGGPLGTCATDTTCPAGSGLPPTSRTSTVYATSVYTITSCAPTVTDCPAEGHVTTVTYPVAPVVTHPVAPIVCPPVKNTCAVKATPAPVAHIPDGHIQAPTSAPTATMHPLEIVNAADFAGVKTASLLFAVAFGAVAMLF